MEFMVRAGLSDVDPSGFQTGDIVQVQPDGWAWHPSQQLSAYLAHHGNADNWPANHFICKIPDCTEALSALLVTEEVDEVNEVLIHTRRFAVDLNALLADPAYVIAQTTGEVHMTQVQAMGFVVDKTTGMLIDV